MKAKTWILFLLLCLITSECTTVMFPADMRNPCSPGGDSKVCNEWKREFPKEYEAYQLRMKHHEKSGKLKKYQDRARSN